MNQYRLHRFFFVLFGVTFAFAQPNLSLAAPSDRNILYGMGSQGNLWSLPGPLCVRPGHTLRFRAHVLDKYGASYQEGVSAFRFTFSRGHGPKVRWDGASAHSKGSLGHGYQAHAVYLRIPPNMGASGRLTAKNRYRPLVSRAVIHLVNRNVNPHAHCTWPPGDMYFTYPPQPNPPPTPPGPPYPGPQPPHKKPPKKPYPPGPKPPKPKPPKPKPPKPKPPKP